MWLVSAAALAAVSAAPFVPVAKAAESDQRIEVVLDAGERATLLAGMRVYLESIQSLTAALAESRAQHAEASVRRSGAKMLQDVSPLTALKLPVGFMSMSLDTHDKFDQLADRIARSASRTEVLSDLTAILANCTSCHMTYRVVPRQ